MYGWANFVDDLLALFLIFVTIGDIYRISHFLGFFGLSINLFLETLGVKMG